jgi:endonuclease YncB( thermonuclease family)
MYAIIALFVFLITLPAWAGSIRCTDDGEGGACIWGRVEGFDGASVQIRGIRVHLAGIGVPARRDLCKSRTETFDCARPARKRMADLLAKGVACDVLDVAGDKLYGRCHVADGDLGRLLVAAGTAKAAKDGPYEPDQQAALSARRGLWAADMILPKDWETVRKKAD